MSERGSSGNRDGFAPVLAFDTDDPEFARGFEAGRIWALLSTEGPEALERQPFHATNVEVVLRMIDALGLEGISAEFTEDPVWMVLRHA